MPRLFKALGWVVFFWSNEGSPTECVHVHIGKRISPNATKIWVLSDCSTKIANNNSRIPEKELNRLISIIEDNYEEIVELWRKMFGPVIRFYDKGGGGENV